MTTGSEILARIMLKLAPHPYMSFMVVLQLTWIDPRFLVFPLGFLLRRVTRLISAAHCRHNHFTTQSNNRISTLLSHPSFPTNPVERAGTLIDLYLVSVLLDAGAGSAWSYTEKDDSGAVRWEGGRSEGLAVASYHMFVNGVFSSDSADKLRVDGEPGT
jgi:hypothetical protein